MKEFLKKLLQKFWDKLRPLLENLVDKIIQHIDKVLKGLGFAGIGGISFLAYKDAFDDSLDRFGVFARFLQIDDLFDKIDNSFGQTLNGVLNTNFTGVCSAFGIVTAINEILSAIGWSLIIFIALMVFKWFVNGLMVLLTIAPK